MTNAKNTKRALICSVLALLICFAMLLGTTYAWFTDSAASVNNVIKSGTLEVKMYYADGSKAVPADDSADWVNAEGKAIYTADQLWEPGYTDAKHIKISNEGTLALKYQLAIIPTGEVSKLAEVIDVYLYEIKDTDANATQVASRNDIDAAMYFGTLAEVISKGIVQGNLAADADYTTTIVLRMQEDADNEYQDLSIGDSFTIQLLATQYTAESDSFDDRYDADAWASGMQVYTAEDLQAAINAGEDVVLMNDIVLDETIMIPAPAATTFSMRAVDETVIDLNGNNITTEGSTAIRSEGHLRIVGSGKITSVSGYAIRIQSGSLVIDSDEVEVSSDFGAISAFNGAEVTINGGNYFNRGYNNKTTHTIYLGGYGTININGGTFDSGYSNNGIDTICGYGSKNAAGEKARININGGTFYPSELNGSYYFISNYDGEWTEININGGVFQKYNPSKIGGTKITAGFKVLQSGEFYYVVPDGAIGLVSNTEELIDAIKAAPANGESIIYLADGVYNGNVDITLAAIGSQKGDLVFKAMGDNAVIAGTVTLGLYQKGTTNVAQWKGNVTFDGITFDHSEAAHHSIEVQNLYVLTLNNCTIVGDGEYGINSVKGCEGRNSRMIGCTFKNAGMQLTGNFATGLLIDGCHFIESCINVQGGSDVTIQGCDFVNTLKDVHNNESFYVIRESNAGCAIAVNDCDFTVRSEMTFKGTAGAKGWGVFVNRVNKDITVDNVRITLSEEAMAQEALQIACCTADSTAAIVMTKVLVNGVENNVTVTKNGSNPISQ